MGVEKWDVFFPTLKTAYCKLLACANGENTSQCCSAAVRKKVWLWVGLCSCWPPRVGDSTDAAAHVPTVCKQLIAHFSNLQEKGITVQKAAFSFGRRVNISKVLLWFGAEFLNLVLLCFLLIHFSCGTKSSKGRYHFHVVFGCIKQKHWRMVRVSFLLLTLTQSAVQFLSFCVHQNKLCKKICDFTAKKK